MIELKRLLADESGASAIEYGILAAVVSVIAAGSLGRLGGAAATMFGTVGTLLTVFGGAAN